MSKTSRGSLFTELGALVFFVPLLANSTSPLKVLCPIPSAHGLTAMMHFLISSCAHQSLLGLSSEVGACVHTHTAQKYTFSYTLAREPVKGCLRVMGFALAYF